MQNDAMTQAGQLELTVRDFSPVVQNFAPWRLRRLSQALTFSLLSGFLILAFICFRNFSNFIFNFKELFRMTVVSL